MKETNFKTDTKGKENKKPDIKIFVSHRIDLDSETIDNPLYVNVRCGAVFDKRENVDMLGDDTGDNISEKRNMYNELTVQYWAWKNIDADYYGFCHYRRYLSFAEKFEKTDEWAKTGISVNSIVRKYINANFIKAYNLNQKYMIEEISKYDIITTDAIDFFQQYGVKNNEATIDKGTGWHKKEHFIAVRNIIEEKFNKYLKYYDQYMNSKDGHYYHMFIMKKDYFYMYCEFVFGVLFELEKLKIDTTYLSINQSRFYGTTAERLLYGLFMLYIMDNFDVKIGNKQVIFIEHPEKQKEIVPFKQYNNIAIVVRISNYYTPYFSVLLQSIIENINIENNYDIIILEDGILKENKEILLEMINDKNNISIRFVNPENLLEDVKIPINNGKYSREGYYTLFVPWILPNYEKVIVLDSDLILQGNIAEIYQQDIKGYLAGACRDVKHMGMLNNNQNGYADYVYKELKMRNPYNYINTGVILLNTSKIRNEFNLKDIIAKIENNKYRKHEQDIINVIFEDKIKYFRLKYNISVEEECFIYARDKMNFSMIENMPKKYYDEYKLEMQSPFILHYTNYSKPWHDTNRPLAYKWWKLAKKTPFYEMIMHRMIDEHSNDITHNILCREIANEIGSIKKIKYILNKIIPHGSVRKKIVKKILFQ